MSPAFLGSRRVAISLVAVLLLAFFATPFRGRCRDSLRSRCFKENPEARITSQRLHLDLWDVVAEGFQRDIMLIQQV